MARKTSLFLLTTINYFYLQWFIARKRVWSNKGKEICGLELVSSKSSSSQFDFHLCNTVATVDLFVVATVIAAAAAIVVPVVDAVGKNVQA